MIVSEIPKVDVKEVAEILEGDGNGSREKESQKNSSDWESANMIAGSRDFPDCRTPEKAWVRIVIGRGMGITNPVISVMSIRVQNGRVSMDSILMAGVIERDDTYDFRVIEHTAEKCVMEFTRDGAIRGTAEFTITEAREAGLTNKDVWKKYPHDMLFWRALSRGARQYCAGIFGGAVYVHEELGIAVDEEGRALESESGGDNGNELCTKQQREEIRRLVAALGMTEKQHLADLGVQLLDELSGYEADKEIKKLAKKAEKAAKKFPRVIPADPDAGLNSVYLTPAQQTIAEAFADSAKPSTPQQRQKILDLAETLVPNEVDCREMLVGALTRRGKTRMVDLDFLQANALIEGLKEKIKQQPPFDPTPTAGKDN